MALTALEIKSLTCPTDKKQIKKSDGNGLFIIVKSNSSKLWLMRFKYASKSYDLSFGAFPLVSLSKARELAKEARLLLNQGKNPVEEKRERKRRGNPEDKMFKVIALKWWEKDKGSWTVEYANKLNKLINKDMKDIEKIHIAELETFHITDLMLKIEATGALQKPSLVLSVINRVFRYALALRMVKINPAQFIQLRDMLKPLPKTMHFPAVTKTSDLVQLIRDIDTNELGSFCTIEALKLIPRIFLRPKEIRELRWEYIDFESRIISIPADKMKKSREHLVPMSTQVLKQLQEVKEMTGYSIFVFPNERNSGKPISKNVLTNRLRALGYTADVVSAHGFRSTASTILHEKGWEHNIIETQLAHLTGSSTSRAYNRSLYLPDRKIMMQEWSDFLEGLSSN